MQNEKVMDRIKKLFALAGNNSNEHEAAQAMRSAKRLLDKHNLSMVDLDPSQQESVSVEYTDEKNMPYVKTVYGAIAKLYDCKYIISKQFKPVKHLIVGTESNRTTASIVIRFVLAQVRDKSVGLGNGYRNAVAVGVYEQVMEILKERNASKEEVIIGTGLVPIDISKKAIQDVSDWVRENMNVTSGKRSNNAFDGSGLAAGRSINLGPHLSNRRGISHQ